MSFSYEKLAKESSIDPNTLWRWDKGKRNPPYHILEKHKQYVGSIIHF